MTAHRQAKYKAFLARQEERSKGFEERPRKQFRRGSVTEGHILSAYVNGERNSNYQARRIEWFKPGR